MDYTFGIDLGTTNSTIAIFEGGAPESIGNENDSNMTPSIIYFSGDDDLNPLVGDDAKNSYLANPQNGVKSIKRHMGEKDFAYTSPGGKQWRPEELSSLILRKLAKTAEMRVGEGNVKDVVITVPAAYDSPKRDAVKAAGTMAGLNVLNIINEPTAAALAYGIKFEDENKTILVYDLGGGTFDTTILRVENKQFDVIGTLGDPNLGGDDFDIKLEELIIDKLKDLGHDNISQETINSKAFQANVEMTKRNLSNVETANRQFPIDEEGNTEKVSISREEFEDETRMLLKRSEDIVKKLLGEKKLSWSNIDDVVMVGGSSHMPMVKKMLKRVSGHEILSRLNPDTAVALGAAIDSTIKAQSDYTGVIPSGEGSILAGIKIKDVTSKNLGVIVQNDSGEMENSILIEHNTQIPASATRTYYTVEAHQTSLRVQVTEGNDSLLKNLHVIGEQTLPVPDYSEVVPVEITFSYDENQIVHIGVIDGKSRESLGTFEIKIEGSMSKDQIKTSTDFLSKLEVD